MPLKTIEQIPNPKTYFFLIANFDQHLIVSDLNCRTMDCIDKIDSNAAEIISHIPLDTWKLTGPPNTFV